MRIVPWFRQPIARASMPKSVHHQVADSAGANMARSSMRVAEPQTNDPQLVARYEQQLCLSVQGLGRIVGRKWWAVSL